MSRRNAWLGSYNQYHFPRLHVKEPPAAPYIRHEVKQQRNKNAGRGGKLTWEQVCEIRRWHEEEGLGPTACFAKAKELGWPVSTQKPLEKIIYYVNRNKA